MDQESRWYSMFKRLDQNKNLPTLMAYLGGELHLGEARQEIDDKVPSAFMRGDGRKVTSVKLNHEEAREGVDDEVPGAFMRREGRQFTGEKC